MEKVIVTVMRAGEPVGLDLEVPAELEAGALARLIAACFDQAVPEPDRSWQLEAHPPGRPLQPQESLASAGVWDGAWLMLK